MTGVRRRVWSTSILLLAMTALLASGWAQVADDPRNQSDEFYNALNGADCYGCHEGEGFTAGRISFKQAYSMLPIGEEVPLTLLYVHDSGNTQTIQNIAVTVNTSKAPNVKVRVPVAEGEEEATANIDRTFTKTVDSATTLNDGMPVQAGASELFASVRVTSELTVPPSLASQEIKASLSPPNAEAPEWDAVDGSPIHKELALDQEQLRDLGTGRYTLAIVWEDPSRIQPQVEVEVILQLVYEEVATEYTFRLGDSVTIPPGTPPAEVEIPITLTGPGVAELDFKVESVSYWPHSAGDGAPRDDGLFWRFAKMRIEGGDQLIVSQGASGPAPVGVNVDLMNMFTRIIGFTSLILIPVSMVTGGMFGKASRRWMNKITGGAKKRVLWHSAMSWMIIAIASMHFILALVESKFVWTKGLLWGGLGWALLISLGFTGYYQVRMIKRWNYRTWRHTHLWSAVAVLSFGLFHMLLDGSSLGVIRDFFGGSLDFLIWP